jgi:hypothetical protein
MGETLGLLGERLYDIITQRKGVYVSRNSAVGIATGYGLDD